MCRSWRSCRCRSTAWRPGVSRGPLSDAGGRDALSAVRGVAPWSGCGGTVGSAGASPRTWPRCGDSGGCSRRVPGRDPLVRLFPPSGSPVVGELPWFQRCNCGSAPFLLKSVSYVLAKICLGKPVVCSGLGFRICLSVLVVYKRVWCFWSYLTVRILVWSGVAVVMIRLDQTASAVAIRCTIIAQNWQWKKSPDTVKLWTFCLGTTLTWTVMPYLNVSCLYYNCREDMKIVIPVLRLLSFWKHLCCSSRKKPKLTGLWQYGCVKRGVILSLQLLQETRLY